MKTFKTAKGTELPISDIKGKDYLQVAYRLVWFREEKPTWSIKTERVDCDKDSALFRAEILDESGRTISVAHKREHKTHFNDFEEKAETGSIGRALAHLGYGTQFAPDLDEGERLADSPLGNGANKTERPKEKFIPKDDEIHKPYVFTFGQKFKNKRVDEIPVDQLTSWLAWAKKQPNPDMKMREAIAAVSHALEKAQFAGKQ